MTELEDQVRYTALLTVVASMNIACGSPTGPVIANDPVTGTFSATIDGKPWVASRVSMEQSLSRLSTVGGQRPSPEASITLYLKGVLGLGVYRIGAGLTRGEVSIGALRNYGTDSATVVVTRWEPRRVAGTFAFEATWTWSGGVSDTTTVENGVFDVQW